MLQISDHHFLSISYSFVLLSAGGIDNQLHHAMVESIHGSLSQPLCAHSYKVAVHSILSHSVTLLRRLQIGIWWHRTMNRMVSFPDPQYIYTTWSGNETESTWHCTTAVRGRVCDGIDNWYLTLYIHGALLFIACALHNCYAFLSWWYGQFVMSCCAFYGSLDLSRSTKLENPDQPVMLGPW